MSEQIQTPRILAPHLQKFQHKIVRVTGKVVQLRGETAVIDAGGNIDVILTRDCHLTENQGVEIVGKVDQNLHIKALQSTPLGPSVDYESVAAVVNATHRYKEIFYDD